MSLEIGMHNGVVAMGVALSPQLLNNAEFAVLMNRAGNMLIEAGALPADHTMAINNPATQLLARMLGVTAPEGQATSFLNPAST